MIAEISFILQGENPEGFKIDSVECPLTTTFYEIYQYVNQVLKAHFGFGDGYSQLLSHDGQTFWPVDENQLSCVYQQNECKVYVQVIAPLIVHAYIDGQFIQQSPVPETISIGDFTTQILNGIQEECEIAEYQIYDLSNAPIISSPEIDITYNFQAYSSASVILNLIRRREVPQLEQQQNEELVQNDNSDTEEEDPLQYLLILNNVSLIIDPKGQYVAYRFHQPLRMAGIFKKSLSKPKNKIKNIKLDQLNWIVNNNIGIAQIDEHGLAVRWEDDSYSVLKAQ